MIWDSDSENENEKSKEEEEIEKKESQKSEKSDKSDKSDVEDEDSDEDTRKIKSPKEKIKDLIKNKYRSIKNAIKSTNYKGIVEAIDELTKNNDKILSIFKKEEIPPFFYECFLLMEDITNISKEDQKKLSKENNNAVGSLKKGLNRINKKLGPSIADYKKNRKTEQELDEIEKKEKEENVKKVEKTKKEEVDESDDEIDILELIKRDEDKEPAQRRLKWVKKEEKNETKEKDKDKKKEKGDKKLRTTAKLADVEEDKNEKVEEKISEKDIEKEYNEFYKQRGQTKSQTDVVSRLEFLFNKSEQKLTQIKLLSLLNLLCFDYYTNQFTALSLDLWKKVYENIEKLMNLHDELLKEKPEQEQQSKDIKNMSLMLQNNLITMMEKLENELYKSFQFNSNNSIDCNNLLINEYNFLKLCKKTDLFFQNLKNEQGIARIYLLVIMHTYYKLVSSIKNFISKNNIKLETDDYYQKIIIENKQNDFKQLCNIVYKKLDEENKVKVMLYQIYFLCIHNDYESAIKLFNISNVFEVISVFKDENLKILFNRTLAQLGLCAFKNLDLEETLRCITPLCNKGATKLKDYLSQNYIKESEKNILFDKEDKKRIIPYIMKINTNDLETIYYLASMINEGPKILLDKITGGNFTTEKTFARTFFNFQKQQFNGPSHVDKDKILATTTVLMRGDWKKCVEEIKQLNLIKKFSFLQNKLFQLIKQTALKCYVIFYMKEFESFELGKLSKRFEIDEKEVKKMINDMILIGNLKAKWNNNYLIMKSNERDSIVTIRKLVDNVQTITRQNLELMQAALACTNNE